MNRYIYSFIAAITIVSCNDARKSETIRVLEDVDQYIAARPDSALAVLEGIDAGEQRGEGKGFGLTINAKNKEI